jgi:hypothetical protein
VGRVQEYHQGRRRVRGPRTALVGYVLYSPACDPWATLRAAVPTGCEPAGHIPLDTGQETASAGGRLRAKVQLAAVKPRIAEGEVITCSFTALAHRVTPEPGLAVAECQRRCGASTKRVARTCSCDAAGSHRTAGRSNWC